MKNNCGPVFSKHFTMGYRKQDLFIWGGKMTNVI